jgi:hypothetical protein
MRTTGEVVEPDWRSRLVRTGWAITFGLGALGIYLFATHSGHLVSALPYLLLLLCPAMHLFGHKHGHRGNDRDARQQ